jgi:hypothetical protein
MTPIVQTEKSITEILKEGRCPVCGTKLHPDGGCYYCPCGCWSACA